MMEMKNRLSLYCKRICCHIYDFTACDDKNEGNGSILGEAVVLQGTHDHGSFATSEKAGL